MFFGQRTKQKFMKSNFVWGVFFIHFDPTNLNIRNNLPCVQQTGLLGVDFLSRGSLEMALSAGTTAVIF